MKARAKTRPRAKVKVKAGPAPRMPGVPLRCTLAEFAQIVTRLHGVKIYRSQISRALKQGMPDSPHHRGAIDTRTALPWWEENRVKTQADPQDDLAALAAEARLRKQIDDARLAATEADEAERQLDNKWILRADARLTVLGALRLHHGFVKKHLEKILARRLLELLTPMDYSETQLARLKDALNRTGREIIAACETDCEAY